MKKFSLLLPAPLCIVWAMELSFSQLLDGQFLAIGIYFGFLSLIACKDILGTKKITHGQFSVGGRGLNFYVTAISAHASDMSSWIFMAFPAMLFTRGPSGMWVALGLILGMYLNWTLVARRLRERTATLQVTSLTALFAKRFGDKSGALQVVTLFLSSVFLMAYLISGLMATGILLESVFSIPYHMGLVGACAVVLMYTIVGGSTSIAWTDFFQGIFLLGALILVCSIAYFHYGGASGIISGAQDLGRSMRPFQDTSFQGISLILLQAMGWGIGYLGMPHILNRFMAINKPAEMNKSRILGMSWQVLTLMSSGLVGLIGLSYASTHQLADPEQLFFQIVRELFGEFSSSLILCAVFSAIISTMDTQILVLATSFTENIYARIKPKASGPQKLRAMRVVVLVLILLTYFISYHHPQSIRSIVRYAWYGLGGTFAPLVLTALYGNRKISAGRAILGAILGGGLPLLWPLIPFQSNYWTQFPAIIPAFLLSMVCMNMPISSRKQ